MRTRNVLACLLFLGLILGGELPSQSLGLKEGLDELAPLFENPDLKIPDWIETSRDCATLFAVASLNYRRHPDKFRNEFFALLIVNDYAERASGKYNMVAPDEVASVINSAITEQLEVEDERLQAVVGFCALKNRNLWVDSPGGRVSLARVLRGIALEAVLTGTDENGLEIANAVDKNASSAAALLGKERSN